MHHSVTVSMDDLPCFAAQQKVDPGLESLMIIPARSKAIKKKCFVMRGQSLWDNSHTS